MNPRPTRFCVPKHAWANRSLPRVQDAISLACKGYRPLGRLDILNHWIPAERLRE